MDIQPVSQPVRSRVLLLLTLGVATGTSHAQWGWCPFGPQTLAEVEARIARQFPDVPQWDPAALATSEHPPVVLDAREPEEYEVSHLSGAIRIGPDASLSDVPRVLGVAPRGTPILRYCSMDRRRSIMADRIRSGLLADGASEVANLRGGILARAIEGRPLVNANGPTRQIHAFDSYWAKLLPPQVRTFVPE
ncbi:MAG: rhodanese-like domain-containing protein [Pseudomonadota bacterium]